MLFTDHPNLITDSGIHPSLNFNCHHQIIYGKFNLKNFYPAPYERHIWHHKHANDDMKDESFHSYKSYSQCHENFIPNEIVTIDDREPP